MKCKRCGRQWVWMKSRAKLVQIDGSTLSQEDCDWLVANPNKYMEVDVSRHKLHVLFCKEENAEDNK